MDFEENTGLSDLSKYTTTQLGILVENCTDFGIFFTRHDDMVEIHRKRPKSHDKFVFSAPNKVWRSSYLELEDCNTHFWKVIALKCFEMKAISKRIFLKSVMEHM